MAQRRPGKPVTVLCSLKLHTAVRDWVPGLLHSDNKASVFNSSGTTALDADCKVVLKLKALFHHIYIQAT